MQKFLSFFETPNVKHMAAKKLKMTVQKLTETVQEYDKGLKYLLSKLDYKIDEQLLIQWFVVGIYRRSKCTLD